MALSSFPTEEGAYYKAPKKAMNVVVTAYSSSVDETDSTPYITASGTFVRPGVAASNVLPFGTKFRIPEFFGNTVFTVEDKMHPRYNGKNWVDIWFESKAKAQSFGKQVVEIEII
jgi:3D (Asp-Asp-Asp) domain-containing protein